MVAQSIGLNCATEHEHVFAAIITVADLQKMDEQQACRFLGECVARYLAKLPEDARQVAQDVLHRDFKPLLDKI